MGLSRDCLETDREKLYFMEPELIGRSVGTLRSKSPELNEINWLCIGELITGRTRFHSLHEHSSTASRIFAPLQLFELSFAPVPYISFAFSRPVIRLSSEVKFLPRAPNHRRKPCLHSSHACLTALALSRNLKEPTLQRSGVPCRVQFASIPLLSLGFR